MTQTSLCFRLIDEERESNAVAETEKRSRMHGKRSASQFQLDSIVGIYPTYDQVKTRVHLPLNRLFYSRSRHVQFASMRLLLFLCPLVLHSQGLRN